MALQNKMFTNTHINDSAHKSKFRLNREYLLTPEVASELNTYNNFGIFNSFNDAYVQNYDKNGKPIEKGSSRIGALGVRSIFNKAGVVLLATNENIDVNNIGLNDCKKYVQNASELRISNNVPLMDSPSNRERIRKHSGCSVKELVQASEKGLLGRAIYSYSDFMYCKYLGQIPNNYLITLRRFPIPPGDFISGLGEGDTRVKEGKNNSGQQIGCMVTWMGAPGNEMSNILKYSTKMPFQEKTAGWNDADSDADGGPKGPLNSIAAAFDPAYRKQFNSGMGGELITKYMQKMYMGDKLFSNGPYTATQMNNQQDDNKVYGPIDRVKKTYMRSTDGLDFEQDITLTFDYELRAYNGVNGRQAMLDLISNILNVTYSTGTFWGGGYKGAGMHQNSIFANLKVFKANGGFTDFMDAFTQDYSTLMGAGKAKFDAFMKNPIQGLKALLNNIGGMFLNGMLNTAGRPQKSFANSLLSEQPVGFWHLTVGNPHHPIISIGNMILTDTEIEHYGPLGLDDFPTGLKVTCKLKRGKPRDIREIEKMYMHGNDRIYYSMGPKVIDMYKRASEYKSGKISFSNRYNIDDEMVTEKSLVSNNVASDEVSLSDYNASKRILQKYFGETDTYSIVIAAKEQENGAFKKKKKSKTPK